MSRIPRIPHRWGGPLAAALLLAILPVAAVAQLLDAPPPVDLPDVPLQARLWQAEKLAADPAVAPDDLAPRLRARGFAARDDGQVMVAIVGPLDAAPVPDALVRSHGGVVRRTWRSRTSAWLPPAQASSLAAALPDGFVLEAAARPLLADEGPAAVGSDLYLAGGADGSGKTIAVIDAGYDELSEARAAGAAPPLSRTVIENYTDTAFEEEDDGTHGTGCVEAAYDHCPGADWRLYKVASFTDAASAVDDAIASGADVITHSISWQNQGWDDDDGGACAMAQDAADAGLLFFTAAGNYAQRHHQAVFHDPDGNGWHNFDGDDELLRITEPAEADTDFYLSWDRSGGGHNLDLYLYDDDGNVLASSTSLFEIYEEIDWSTDATTSQDVHLGVYQSDGGATTFEIFEYKAGDWQEYEVPESSTTSPSNTTDPNVLAVGAVHWNQFGQPSGSTGVLASYSSRGPSNSGMTLPDLCGPTSTTGVAYPSGFSGTSCATPNAAGAATAFWSSAPELSATGVRYLLLEQAQIFRDWGAAGPDDLHGRGGIQLHEHAPHTTWLDRRVGNTAGLPSLPYFFVGQAVLATPAGGRLVFLGQAYPEPLSGLDKALQLESIGTTAVLGATGERVTGP